MLRILPPTTDPRATRLLVARGLRAGADGLVAATLTAYLASRGFSAARIGLLVTATLLGSAVVVLVVGSRADRVQPGQVLRGCAVAMVFTGALFAVVPWFVPLLVVAAFGPLNPSAGDVSAFLPAEQALLPSLVGAEHRTALFARYSLVAFGASALGAAVAGAPLAVGRRLEWSTQRSLSMVFWLYALLGAVLVFVYGPVAKLHRTDAVRSTRLGESKARIRKLAALFCVDSAGGGFVVTSLIALWLDRRHHFSLAQVGGALAAMQMLSALSSLAAPALARRFGLVRTMVFTHLPANALLIGAAFAPSGRSAVVLLMARALLSQMDVPARQSYVMSIVQPAERAAAAAYTNVPRSLASAATPALAGWMLGRSNFGWPLVIGGTLKATYDLLLLHQFGRSATEGSNDGGEHRSASGGAQPQ